MPSILVVKNEVENILDVLGINPGAAVDHCDFHFIAIGKRLYRVTMPPGGLA